MWAYLGSLGALVPIPGMGILRPDSLSLERPATYRRTLGGRVTARVGARTHRAWSVQPDTVVSPTELAAVQAFVSGVFGPGPWWWVDPWAQVTNVLTPRDGENAAGWSNVVQGGPVVLPDGAVGGSVVKTTSTPAVVLRDGVPALVPVLAGGAVTVSVYASVPGVSVVGTFRNAAGATVGTALTSPASAGVWSRVSVSGTVPVGAVSVEVSVTGPASVAVACPAVTWTDAVMPYGAPGGADKVLVSALSQDVVLAHAGRNGQFSGGSFVVTEVG